MVLQSLVKYYEILADDPESGISRSGYCKVNVSFALRITESGELTEVIPLKIPQQRGKKTVYVPQSMVVPEQVKKTVGISSNFLCEGSSYVFGVDDKGKPERAIKCFNAFCDLHNELLSTLNCEEATALLNFIKHWDPTKAYENELLKPWLKEIFSSNLVFRLDGGSWIHENAEIKKRWMDYKNSGDNDVISQCLVTGEKQPIERLHPNIKSVKGAQTAGAAIVSFNASAYESFGKEQGFNSPVSKYASFAYTTVLNHMLSSRHSRILLGDASVVFWAESTDNTYRDIISCLFSPDFSEPVKIEAKPERTVKTEHLVKSILEKIMVGQPVGNFLDEFDPNTNFYILGLSPNAARLSIRFFLTDSFGGFLEKIGRHYKDLQIGKEFANQPDTISLWKLLNQTVSPTAKDKSSSPLLTGSVMRSSLTGAPYPASLYNGVMCRIRAEKEINYFKAAIIKAYLIRKPSVGNSKEVLTVSLNETSVNKAYLLGRLFAVLEKAQQDANPGINTTIKDRYFTSACATPASVFPVLLRLSQHHITKADYGYISDKRIETILAKLDIASNPIPSHMNLDEQGIFILGYYHQKNAFFTKNTKEENENE